jgi:hypothetical protein
LADLPNRAATFRYFVLEFHAKGNICNQAFLEQCKPSRTASDVNLPLFCGPCILSGRSSIYVEKREKVNKLKECILLILNVLQETLLEWPAQEIGLIQRWKNKLIKSLIFWVSIILG